MDIGSTLINFFVVVAMGAFLAYMSRERFADLKRELKAGIARLDTGLHEAKGDMAQSGSRFERRLDGGLGELRTDIRRLEERMDAGFRAVHAEFSLLRSDVTAVALAVGAKPPRAARQSGER
jgi:hypothetical protein